MNALVTERSQELNRTARLVLAAQAGDRAAFGDLFVMIQPSVYNIAFRRTGNVNDAMELVQDVFIQAMEKIDQLRTPEAFAGWIRQIAVRMSINRVMRRRAGLATEPGILQATVLCEDAPDAGLMEREQAVQVRAGLARLRPLDRETLEAFYVRGKSLAEMAVEFNAPLGTIKRRLHVARKRLANEVDESAVV